MMSEQNKTAPMELPAKRKRGRPRKDEKVVKKPSSPPSAIETTREAQQVKADKPKENFGVNMVGRIVTGLIDGVFDAGYLLTVRIGNSGTPLRGVAFQPGRHVPFAPANDIAPQAKMYQRRELLMPVLNPQNQTNGVATSPAGNSVISPHFQTAKQAPSSLLPVLPAKPQSSVSSMVNNPSAEASLPGTILPRNGSSSCLGGTSLIQQNQELRFKLQSQSAPPLQNLRMVEQDEVMQVYEVSNSSEGNSVGGKAVDGDATDSSANLNSNLSAGNEISQAIQVQNKTVECRTEPDSFGHHEMKQSFMELLKSSIETNANSISQKIGSIEDDQLDSNKVKNQELHQPEETRHHQKKLVDIELNNPTLELHEIPVMAQSLSIGEKLKAAESKLQEKAMVSNESRSSLGSQELQVQIDFQPRKSNNSSFDLHQTPILQCVSEENPKMKLENHSIDLAQNTLKSSDLWGHQCLVTQKQNFVQAMESELQPNTQINSALKKSNLELHQSLFNESQLLDLIHEPVDFMLEKQHSPKNGTLQDTNSLELEANKEVKDNETSKGEWNGASVGNEQSSHSVSLTTEETPCKLELAVKDSALTKPENHIFTSTCSTSLELPLGSAAHPSEYSETQNQ